jgi:hypothetical protein
LRREQGAAGSISLFSISPSRHRINWATGVIVNKFPNVSREYLNQIRAMLHALEKYKFEKAQTEFEAKYFKRHKAPWAKAPSIDRVLRGKIEYVGAVRGRGSEVYLRLLRKLREIAPGAVKKVPDKKDALRQRFEEMKITDDPNKRGFEFQTLLQDIFALFQIEVTNPFTRNNGAEQIDGAFQLDSWHYIVEARWREKLADARQVDGLYGQVGRSGRQTMGVFVSVNGWSENVPKTLKQNAEKAVVLVDGQDLFEVLRGRIDLRQLLKGKLTRLNAYAEPFASAEDLIKSSR